jgi:glycosyltransferase involved in cell wall biosynthesis
LHQRGLKFEIQFAGEVPLHTDYGVRFTQKLADAEKAGYAKRLGFLSATQLIAAMDAADALVHFPTEESFGLVVAEALARDLKLFGAATGGVMDIATGAEGAELFAADDFAGLEKAIAGWINAGGQRPENASALMRARYHPEVVARQHLEIYREVLGRSGKK